MGAASDEGARDGLLAAYVTLSGISDDLTRLAATMLAPDATSNRGIQILLLAKSSPGTTPSQVAVALRIHRSAASRLLRPLEQDGLLERRADAVDGRLAHLYLTPLGQERITAFTGSVDRYVVASADLFRGLSRSLAAAAGDAPVHGGPPTSDDATLLLARAGAAFEADLEPLLPAVGVTHRTDRAALAVVRLRGEVHPSQLAEALRLGSSGAAGLVRRLSRAGLVERRPDPDDGRAALVTCTPRGADAVDVLLDVLGRHAGVMAATFAWAVDAARSTDRAAGATADPGSGAA